MKTSRLVVLGIGSNLGDRFATVEAVFTALAADPELGFIAKARLYETKPVGGPTQGDFLNTAALLDTSLDPREILRKTGAIEASLGRTRGPERNLPRTVDIDILWIEGESVDSPSLTVPHPRLRERRFALRPLLDLAPTATDPRDGASYRRVDDTLASTELATGECLVSPVSP